MSKFNMSMKKCLPQEVGPGLSSTAIKEGVSTGKHLPLGSWVWDLCRLCSCLGRWASLGERRGSHRRSHRGADCSIKGRASRLHDQPLLHSGIIGARFLVAMLTGDVRLLHRSGQGRWLLHRPIQSSIAWGLLAPGVCDVDVSGMCYSLPRVLFPGLAP